MNINIDTNSISIIIANSIISIVLISSSSSSSSSSSVITVSVCIMIIIIFRFTAESASVEGDLLLGPMGGELRWNFDGTGFQAHCLFACLFVYVYVYVCSLSCSYVYVLDTYRDTCFIHAASYVAIPSSLQSRALEFFNGTGPPPMDDVWLVSLLSRIPSSQDFNIMVHTKTPQTKIR